MQVDTSSVTNPRLLHILHFQRRAFVKSHVVTGFGGPKMAKLLIKLELQGWSNLFLQGNDQQKYGIPEVVEFYTNGKDLGSLFSTSVRGVPLVLSAEDISCILEVPSGGWSHYVKFE